MVNENNPKQEKKFGEESLLPQDVRIMGKPSYLMAWIGASISIGVFMSGSSLVPPAGQLNLLQAFLAMVIGLTVCAIAYTLNGSPGHKYGIPFIVQTRSAFGMRAKAIPAIVRALPALFWYGVQSWVAATAFDMISLKLFGFSNVFLYFIGFQAFQIFISTLGFKGIKWLENIGAVAILLAVFYMLYVIYTNFASELGTNIINIEGTWGLPFWGATVVMLGVYTPVILNISDIARELDKGTTTKGFALLHWFGLVPATAFLALAGILSAGATGIWNPVQLFAEAIPNTTALIVVLLFIIFAQVTTNVLNNVVPTCYVMMDVFNISYRKAAIVLGVVALGTFPWRIASEGFFQLFIQMYSAFLGPIFAVLIVDYFILRKRTLNVEMYYDEKGPFNGVNWSGVIAIVIGAAFALIEVKLSWYASLFPAGLSYYFLMKYSSLNKSFLKGTIFENKDKLMVDQKTVNEIPNK